MYIDFIDMIDRCANYRYLIIVVCPYSRWIEAGPSVHCDAKAAATFLVREVIPRWGVPDVIRSDNRKHFVNTMFDNICILMGITHKLASASHP